MDRSPQHIQGYLHASREAVTWLLEKAKSMNDPSAKAAINVAADELGRFLAAKTKERGE